jgi:hypothetical protein
MSYTEEVTQLIITEYSADPTRATVDRLAEEHNKSARSIIAKLSSAGVYQAPPRLSKNGDAIVRKEDLVKDIGEWFGLEIPSLAKAGKLDLQRLYSALSNPDFVRAHLVDLEDQAA